ncbi:MAG: division plane positioning ATPase MipZ [Ferrimicrobium acidiphilum]
MDTDKKLIFSTGAKGGVGKSTLAILMVEALLEGEATVACLEGDERSASLGAKYGLSSRGSRGQC